MVNVGFALDKQQHKLAVLVDAIMHLMEARQNIVLSNVLGAMLMESQSVRQATVALSPGG